MANSLTMLKPITQGLTVGTLGLGLAFSLADPAQAQSYGPRQFLPAPSGTNAVIFQISIPTPLYSLTPVTFLSAAPQGRWLSPSPLPLSMPRAV